MRRVVQRRHDDIKGLQADTALVVADADDHRLLAKLIACRSPRDDATLRVNRHACGRDGKIERNRVAIAVDCDHRIAIHVADFRRRERLRKDFGTLVVEGDRPDDFDVDRKLCRAAVPVADLHLNRVRANLLASRCPCDGTCGGVDRNASGQRGSTRRVVKQLIEQLVAVGIGCRGVDRHPAIRFDLQWIDGGEDRSLVIGVGDIDLYRPRLRILAAATVGDFGGELILTRCGWPPRHDSRFRVQSSTVRGTDQFVGQDIVVRINGVHVVTISGRDRDRDGTQDDARIGCPHELQIKAVWLAIPDEANFEIEIAGRASGRDDLELHRGIRGSQRDTNLLLDLTHHGIDEGGREGLPRVRVQFDLVQIPYGAKRLQRQIAVVLEWFQILARAATWCERPCTAGSDREAAIAIGVVRVVGAG